MFSASHRADDTSSPFTSGAINLSAAQFGSQYVRNPVRNQYRRFMRAKTPYARPRT